MDPDTIKQLAEMLSILKAIQEASSAYAIQPYVYGPVSALALAIGGGGWRYYIKVVDGFVARADAGEERVREMYESQITRNEAQFERMSDLAQAIKDNTDAVKALNGGSTT